MELPVFCQGAPTGKLMLEETGGRIRAEMDCPIDRTGLFRGYLICRNGEKSLGVLEPRGERLRLCRMLLGEEIRALGAAGRGELRLSFAFRREEGWQSLPHPEQFFHRAPFGPALRDLKGALWRESRGLRLLALPFDSTRPFPLVTLFCFARVEDIQGRPFAVFTFDAKECPVMPAPLP